MAERSSPMITCAWRTTAGNGQQHMVKQHAHFPVYSDKVERKDCTCAQLLRLAFDGRCKAAVFLHTRRQSILQAHLSCSCMLTVGTLHKPVYRQLPHKRRHGLLSLCCQNAGSTAFRGNASKSCMFPSAAFALKA
jgi:hypothetical protein